MSTRSKIGLLNYISPQCKKITTSLLSLSLMTSTILAQTPNSLKTILLPTTNLGLSAVISISSTNKNTETIFFLFGSDNIDQSRPGVPSNPAPSTNSGQSRPGVPSNPSTTTSSSQSRPGVAISGLSRPGVGGAIGLPTGVSLSRPGVSAVSRPGVERSQALGVQQVGEATAQATRRAINTGPEAILAVADKLVDNGEINKAISKYQQIIKDNPNLAGAYAGLGYAYIQAEDFDVAIETLKTAIDKDKKDQEAQVNLGVALYRSGNIAEAIKQYKNLIESKSPSAEVYYNLGIAYAHEGEFESAVENINTAISKRKNKYPEAYNNLGLIYEARGEDQKAIDSFKTAVLQQNNNYPLAGYNLARLYLGKANSKESKFEAIKQYKQVTTQKPNFAEAYLDMGNAYIFLTIHSVNTLADALKTYQEALSLRGGVYPLAHENIAITYSKMGDKEEAFKHYYMAFEQYDGRCPEALQNLVTTINGDSLFTISNELLQANNVASLKNKQTKKFNEKNNKETANGVDEVFFRTMKNLLNYEEIDEEKKDNPLVRYCGARAYAFVGDWYSATNEFISAIELAKKQKTGNKTVGSQQINVTEDAERALITITSNNLVAMLP